MKSLPVFLSCLIPLGALLWILGERGEVTSQLPSETTEPAHPAVLLDSDLADAYGRTPFGGRIRRLEDVTLKVLSEGRVQYYIRLGRLARHAGRPRIEEVTCALFGAPIEGRPRLSMTFVAQTLTGDLAALASGDAEVPKALDLAGGVTARDPRGRELLAVPRLHLDLSAKTASSEDAVTIRIPGREATVRGIGLFVDVGAKRAVLSRKVEADFPASGGLLALACDGPATITELDKGKVLRIVMEGRVSGVHPLARVRCPRLVTELVRNEKGGYDPARASLEEGVAVIFDPEAAHGLERIEVARMVLDGRKTITCEGPVKAVWGGVLAPLGLGRREIEITAAAATILLKGADKGEPALDSLHFTGGFKALDKEGAGGAWAKRLAFFAEGSRLVMEGEAGVKTSEGSIEAERIEAMSSAKKVFSLLVTGLTHFSYVADGKLEPLGERRRGTLRLACKGPLKVEGKGERISLHADKKVVAWVGEESRLETEKLSVELESGRLTGVDAQGGIFLRGRGAEIRGEGLAYSEEIARISGSPASVRFGSDRSVQARRIRYGEDRSFSAEGAVTVRAELKQGKGPWTVTCDRAHGLLAKKGSPRSLVAEGSIRAVGPKGEVVTGDRFEYDAETGRATLTGKPARIERAKDLVLQAPAFDLLVREGRIQEAHSRGGAVLDLVQKSGFRRWHVDVEGPADFTGGRLILPEGARLQAFNAKDKPLLRARAARVEIVIEAVEGKLAARRLLAGGGVEVAGVGKRAASVFAKRLRYDLGSRRVDVFGEVRVIAKGWPKEVLFRHVVFVLTDKGIDLERASEIEVRPPGR